MNHGFKILMLKYPTIYTSAYEVVANALAAKYTFMKDQTSFSEELAEKEIERMFNFNDSLGLKGAMLIHSWYRDCCQYAADLTTEIIEGHRSQN